MSLRHVATLKGKSSEGTVQLTVSIVQYPLRMALWSSDVSQWHIVLIEWCSNNIWGHLSIYIEYGDITKSFIYPTDAQLKCSQRMVKFTLIFTWEVLLHVSVFHNHHQGATICAKVIIINNQLKYVVYRVSSVIQSASHRTDSVNDVF